jgi:hypothetical protein
MANRLERSQYIEADRVKALLSGFCDAIRQKVGVSDLEPGLRAELVEDITSFLDRVSLNGTNSKANGKPRGRRRKPRST